MGGNQARCGQWTESARVLEGGGPATIFRDTYLRFQVGVFTSMYSEYCTPGKLYDEYYKQFGHHPAYCSIVQLQQYVHGTLYAIESESILGRLTRNMDRKPTKISWHTCKYMKSGFGRKCFEVLNQEH